jgi:hypothetical protein
LRSPPTYLRPRRDKIFGEAPAHCLDRNAKARIWARAKSLSRWRPELRCRLLTPAYMDVLKALLWGFHKDDDGRCFPSYDAIAKAADRHRDTVGKALNALEAYGLLTWVHRLKRVRVLVAGLFGPEAVLRPQRSSNAYRFIDPLTRQKSYKTDFPAGPLNQDLKKEETERAEARKSRQAGHRHRPSAISPAPVPPQPPKLLSDESTALTANAQPGDLIAAAQSLRNDVTAANWERFLAARAATINQLP